MSYHHTPAMTRRSFLTAAAVVPALRTPDEIPVSGVDIPELRPFDDVMREHMAARGIPGGALCVLREGRLLLARGYGTARRNAGTPALPTTQFRLASVSKPVTGVAMLTLLQRYPGRVTLDTRILMLLNLEPLVPAGRQADPRLRDITVRHLLQHTAGWDREKSGDQMFMAQQAAREAQVDSPPSHSVLIRWGLGRPLDFDPASRYAYSNFGYCILGRIIEKVSGRPYEEFVRSEVLKPMGIADMWIGGDRMEAARPNEAHYYDAANRMARSLFTAERGTERPLPYAFATPRLMDAHGGWIADVMDLARFIRGVDISRNDGLLSEKSIAAMLQRPEGPPGMTADGSAAPFYYGLGWQVRPRGVGEAPNIWHTGSMPGTSSLLVKVGNGLGWAAVFNQRTDNRALPDTAIDGALHRAAAAVKSWPKHDLLQKS